MRLLLAVVSIIAILVDCRDVHNNGQERRDSADEPQQQLERSYGHENGESVDDILDRLFPEERKKLNFGHNSRNLKVINQWADAASLDDDEDGYAEDEQKSCSRKDGKSCSRQNGKCVPEAAVPDGTCNNTTKIDAKCGKNCICCPEDDKPPRQRKSGTGVSQRLTKHITGSPSEICYKGPCPGNGYFIDIKGCCFLFSSQFPLKLDWHKSRTFCQGIGSTLGVVADLADFSYESCCNSYVPVMEYIAHLGYSHFWLGASDSGVTSSWSWDSAKRLSLLDPFWETTEPNHPGGVNLCLTAWINGPFARAYFADDPCTDEHFFVCQMIF